MTVNNLPPTTAAGPPQPALESFQEAAQQGPWLHVSQDGAQWQVKATGITPSQRSVAWVEPQSEADTTSAFVAALGQSFSRGIQSAVARELGLEPAPGRPLSARTVQQALDMAQTSRTALQGVDFLTQLSVSAAHSSTTFMQACKQLAIDPASLGTEQRTLVDARMEQRFQGAAAERQAPVTPATAREWLMQELRSFTR